MSEETKVATTKPQLPKLEDLHHDVALAFKNDELNLLLNQEPPKQWIKQHPTVKKKVLINRVEQSVPSEYIPIDIVEMLLTKIFQQWKTEILREGVMFQSVYVAVRLHYYNPVTGQWMFQDGVGAVGVQTNAGKSAADLAEIKSAAVQMALPAAESYAIKDAAEKLGKIFGKDLNRKNAIEFSMAYSDFGKPETVEPEPTNPAATPDAPLAEELASNESYGKLMSLFKDPSLGEKLITGNLVKSKFETKLISMYTTNTLLEEKCKEYIKLMEWEIETAKAPK